jgi:phosphoribosylformylglycinamidine cyclo-ligase
VKEGAALVALGSTGLHTNGYSLARKLLFDVAKYSHDQHIPELGAVLADQLLQVHRSYLKPIQTLIAAKALSAAAHITGGGITDNLPRVLPKGLAAAIDTGSWQPPALFELLRGIGQVPEDDWRRTFNLGVGMILVIPASKLNVAEKALKKLGEKPWVIGAVVKQRRGKGRVEYR